MDPEGLWSVSIEFYRGWGGGIQFGRDSNTGQGFMNFRLGGGIGGGINWDPNGGRPGGKDACEGNGGATLGLYGTAGANAGIGGFGAGAGLDLSTGYDFGRGKGYKESGFSRNLGYEPGAKTGFGLGGAGGIE